MKLELVEKSTNTCIINGFVTRDYINLIIASGDKFIAQARAPVFDFSGVEACDSSSVALLIHWWRTAKMQSKTIKFRDIPQEMLAIIKLSNVSKVISNECLETT